jgi:hypothetical protein
MIGAAIHAPVSNPHGLGGVDIVEERMTPRGRCAGGRGLRQKPARLPCFDPQCPAARRWLTLVWARLLVALHMHLALIAHEFRLALRHRLHM